MSVLCTKESLSGGDTIEIVVTEILNYPGLPVRPLIFLKKQKISLEELYGYASSDEESAVEEEGEPNAHEDDPNSDHGDDAIQLSDVQEVVQPDEGNFLKLNVICDTEK